LDVKRLCVDLAKIVNNRRAVNSDKTHLVCPHRQLRGGKHPSLILVDLNPIENLVAAGVLDPPDQGGFWECRRCRAVNLEETSLHD